jgi:hypothetical protein
VRPLLFIKTTAVAGPLGALLSSEEEIIPPRVVVVIIDGSASWASMKAFPLFLHHAALFALLSAYFCL